MAGACQLARGALLGQANNQVEFANREFYCLNLRI